MENLTLTDPIVVPEQVTDTYRVVVLTLNSEPGGPALPPPEGQQPAPAGLVSIQVKDNLGVATSFSYSGQLALDMITWLNTGDFTVTSMHRKILQRLSDDGHLPGTVTGTPAPPPASDPFEVHP